MSTAPATMNTRVRALTWPAGEPRAADGAPSPSPLGAASPERGPHLPCGSGSLQSVRFVARRAARLRATMPDAAEEAIHDALRG